MYIGWCNKMLTIDGLINKMLTDSYSLETHTYCLTKSTIWCINILLNDCCASYVAIMSKADILLETWFYVYGMLKRTITTLLFQEVDNNLQIFPNLFYFVMKVSGLFGSNVYIINTYNYISINVIDLEILYLLTTGSKL